MKKHFRLYSLALVLMTALACNDDDTMMENPLEENPAVGPNLMAYGLTESNELVSFNANSPVRQHALYEGEKKKKAKKNIYVTQRQFDYIQDTINSINGGDMEIGLDEATATTNVGAMGGYTANGLVLKTSDGKKDPCYDR